MGIFKFDPDKNHVFIRFDLTFALEDTKALDKQLLFAKQILTKKLKDYVDLHGIKIKPHRNSVTTFGIYLRLLDAKADGKKNKECAQIVWPKKTEGLDSSEINDIVKKPMQQARAYANEKYRYLALLSGKPDGKEINLGENIK